MFHNDDPLRGIFGDAADINRDGHIEQWEVASYRQMLDDIDEDERRAREACEDSDVDDLDDDEFDNDDDDLDDDELEDDDFDDDDLDDDDDFDSDDF